MSDTFTGLAKSFVEDHSVLVAYAANHPVGETGGDFNVLNMYRPELFALSAIMTKTAVDWAATSRDIALRKQDKPSLWSEFASYDELQARLNSVLLDNILSTTDAHRTPEKSPVYRRLEDLVDMFNSTWTQRRYKGVSDLLRAGAGTAAHMTVAAVAATTRIVRNEHPGAPSEEVAAIARNGTGLITRLAGVNLLHLPHAQQMIDIAGKKVDSEFTVDVQALSLKTKRDGTSHVDFLRPFLQTQNPFAVKPMLMSELPVILDTLGCPATARLDDGRSSVNKLWDIAVSEAEHAGLLTGNTAYDHGSPDNHK